MDTLSASSPLFIRCLKPNVVKSGAMFTPKVVSEQLKYTGMFETVKIRQSGFPKRLPFDFFLERSANQHHPPFPQKDNIFDPYRCQIHRSCPQGREFPLEEGPLPADSEHLFSQGGS